MGEGTIWQRLRWWWTWRVWRPIGHQCSFCGNRLTNGDTHSGMGSRGTGGGWYYGWGAWACASCNEYPEG